MPILFWRDTAKRHVGLIVIVGPQRLGSKSLDFVERLKHMMGKLIIANRPVVSLDVGVLLRLAGRDEIDADPVPSSSGQRYSTDVFRAVIAANRARFAAPFDGPVERSDHALDDSEKSTSMPRPSRL